MDMLKAAAENPQALETPEKYFSEAIINEAISFEPGISFNDFSIGLPEGRIDMNVGAHLTAVDGLTLANIQQNPQLLMQSMKLAADLKAGKVVAEKLARQQARSNIDAQLAQQVQDESVQYTESQIEEMAAQNSAMMLQMLMTQNFIIEDGEDYEASLTMENGEGMRNGNPIPIPLGALLGAAAQ